MIDADAIIAEAEALTGQADTDHAPRANLRRLAASLAAEGGMTAEAVAGAHRHFVADTVNRLEGLKWLARHPGIADEPIEAPVFLMGLPRSGTTYFQYLFDRDERFRLIRTWESMMPSPPPGADPDSVAARQAQWAARRAAQPQVEGFDALHLIDADGSDECHAFIEQSFGAAGLNNIYRCPSFFDWLVGGADLVETYRIHKRQLQLLQWRGERRPWALKYPNHVIAMDAIRTVYPDARMVMTHRDPAQVVASIAKMTWSLRSARTGQPVDKAQVGADMERFIAAHVNRIMAFDAGPQGGSVVHVDYYALVADPVAEMRRIHAGIGIDTPPQVEHAVAQWRAANPPGKRGANAYSLAEYGLDGAAIRHRLSAYVERFAIPTEAEGLARS